MPKRRTYKRDRKGRFAKTAKSAAKAAKHHAPTLRGSTGSVRRGVVGPGGAFRGASASREFTSRSGRVRYYGSVTAGVRLTR